MKLTRQVLKRLGFAKINDAEFVLTLPVGNTIVNLRVVKNSGLWTICSSAHSDTYRATTTEELIKGIANSSFSQGEVQTKASLMKSVKECLGIKVE